MSPLTISTEALLLGAAATVVALELYRCLYAPRYDSILPPRAPPISTRASKRFAGKKALVTGGARGIGRAIALALSREGCTVFIADLLGRAEADSLENSTDSISADWSWIRCDAASTADIEATCARVGCVDILVNNVAVQPEAPCHEHSLEDWSRAIAVNLTSCFLFSKLLLPGMLAAGGGSIVNIASVQGLASQPAIPGYAASKGGVLSLTRQLAVEYAQRGVRVNAISPGTINTPLVKNVLKLRGSSAEKAGASYPCGRIGEPHEVASAAAWLASDEASFVTGQNLVVDGGIMSLGGWAQTA